MANSVRRACSFVMFKGVLFPFWEEFFDGAGELFVVNHISARIWETR